MSSDDMYNINIYIYTHTYYIFYIFAASIQPVVWSRIQTSLNCADTCANKQGSDSDCAEEREANNVEMHKPQQKEYGGNNTC